MIRIKLLCFGITKEIVGTFEKSLEIPEKMTVSGFLENLKNEYSGLRKLNSLRVAVNEEYAEDTVILENKDEVVLIPPVSGG
jgi:molybdopterin synthase sulfur carrier subunit